MGARSSGFIGTPVRRRAVFHVDRVRGRPAVRLPPSMTRPSSSRTHPHEAGAWARNHARTGLHAVHITGGHQVQAIAAQSPPPRLRSTRHRAAMTSQRSPMAAWQPSRFQRQADHARTAVLPTGGGGSVLRATRMERCSCVAATEPRVALRRSRPPFPPLLAAIVAEQQRQRFVQACFRCAHRSAHSRSSTRQSPRASTGSSTMDQACSGPAAARRSRTSAASSGCSSTRTPRAGRQQWPTVSRTMPMIWVGSVRSSRRSSARAMRCASTATASCTWSSTCERAATARLERDLEAALSLLEGGKPGINLALRVAARPAAWPRFSASAKRPAFFGFALLLRSSDCRDCQGSAAPSTSGGSSVRRASTGTNAGESLSGDAHYSSASTPILHDLRHTRGILGHHARGPGRSAVRRRWIPSRPTPTGTRGGTFCPPAPAVAWALCRSQGGSQSAAAAAQPAAATAP